MGSQRVKSSFKFWAEKKIGRISQAWQIDQQMWENNL
jgi:hypothetical protein